MTAHRTPKIFAAVELLEPRDPSVSADDIGFPVEFWLADREAGARGHLVSIVDAVIGAGGVFVADGKVGLVHLTHIGTFAVPLSRLARCPAESPAAGILPPSGASPPAPGGGDREGGRHAG